MPSRTFTLLLTTFVLLVLIGIALFGIQRESLWLDESWSAWIVYDEAPDVDGVTDTLRYLRDAAMTTLDRVRDDMHPPLYFFLLEGWTLLMGESEFVLRLPSVWMGLLGLAGIYALGKQWLHWRAGLYAVVILGTSGFFLHYAQEARMYALLLALSVLSTWNYGLWQQKKSSLWRVIFYALMLSLALYTHYLAAFLILIHALHHLLTRPHWRMILPYGLVALLFAPWLPFLWGQLQAHAGAPMSAFLPSNLDTLSGFWLIFTSGYWYIFLLPFVLGLAIPDAVRNPKDRFQVLLLLLWLLVPLIGLLIINAPDRPLLQLRYLLLSLPAWALLIAYGLSKIRVRYLAWVLLAWMVFTQLSMIDDLWQAKPRWRDAVQTAAETRQSAEPALVHIPAHSPTAYYDRRYGLRQGISLDIGWRTFSPPEVRDLAATLDNADSAWMILPAQDPSSWDALIALSEERGIGYRDSVQGTLLYRLDRESTDSFSFTFGDLLAYEGDITRTYTMNADEICVPLRMQALVDLADQYVVGLYLTRGYNEVLAQNDLPLGEVAAGSTFEREICLMSPAEPSLNELHLRLAIYDPDSLERLPLLESGLLWGDYLVLGQRDH